MGFFDFFRRAPRHDDHHEEQHHHDNLQQHHDEEAARHAFDRATKLLDIDVSIMAHENWKLRLTAYLNGTSSEELRPEVVCCDDKCDLGKWIYGDGGEWLGKYGTFADLKATHKMFHYVASNIVSLHQSGNEQEARATLNGQFDKLSSKIKQRLTDMKAL